MKIITLDMEKYLGRGIKVYFKDGQAKNFKPIQMLGKNIWRGLNDEGFLIDIRKDEIEAIHP